VSSLVLAAAAAPTQAAQSNLGWTDVQEAIAHGKAAYEQIKHRSQAVDDLEPGYVVDLGPDAGRAMLFTEFSAVALEARRFQAIGREMRPEDLETVLGPLRGRLKFTVVLVGGQRDFLRHYTVRLRQGTAQHQPASWNVFRGSPHGQGSRWIASGDYYFAVAGLDLAAPVTLVLSDQSGSAISFDFDLSRLR
jgi:hypothetical protein